MFTHDTPFFKAYQLLPSYLKCNSHIKPSQMSLGRIRLNCSGDLSAFVNHSWFMTQGNLICLFLFFLIGVLVYFLFLSDHLSGNRARTWGQTPWRLPPLLSLGQQMSGSAHRNHSISNHRHGPLSKLQIAWALEELLASCSSPPGSGLTGP